MRKEEVIPEFKREPFVPLRLHIEDHKSVNIPFRDAAWLIGGGVLVFKGKKEGSVMATGYEVFDFNRIVRIEKLPSKSSRHRGRKAS
jgi:hypothetical protein